MVLKQQDIFLNQAADDFLLTKSDLREKPLRKKYSFVIGELKKFALALNIKYVDEFVPDHTTLLYNELIREKETLRGKKRI